MTGKKAPRPFRHSKATMQSNKAAAPSDSTSVSSNKAASSTKGPVTSTKVPATSSSKPSVSSNKGSTSGKKAPAVVTKAQKPASNVTKTTSQNAMISNDFSHMRHRFYIVRPEPNKICVPMVALDELPAGFRPRGVPLTVTPVQINEWDMARVGADVALKTIFEIEDDRLIPSQRGHTPSAGNKSVSSTDETEMSAAAVNVTGQVAGQVIGEDNGEVNGEVNGEGSVNRSSKSDVSMKSESSSKVDFGQPKSKDEGAPSVSQLHQEVNDAVRGVVEKSKWSKENDYSKTQDAATPGVYGKKKYCTHWIRTGNCDYMQEGCRYLHVIPDESTRVTIGIRDMPRWAKEDLPSPPRVVNHVRRRSWSPPKDNRASQKDWRSRGSREFHGERPAGSSLVSRFASERPSTPTPQSTFHGRQIGIQQHKPMNEIVHATAPTQRGLPTDQLPDINRDGLTNVQGEHQEVTRTGPNIAAPQPISHSIPLNQPGAPHQGPNPQGPFTQPPHFTSSMPPPDPRTMPPLPTSSNFYRGFTSPDHETHHFGPAYEERGFSPFQSNQPTHPTPFDNGHYRNDGRRWGHPSLSPFGGMNNHHYSNSRQTPPPGSPFGSIWRRTPMASPAPSFSEASVGTIGHGRPGMASPPVLGGPILHKRMFRQPGESQYVQAKPQPSGKSRSGDIRQSHRANGSNRGQDLGNLISLDEDGNFGGS